MANIVPEKHWKNRGLFDIQRRKRLVLRPKINIISFLNKKMLLNTFGFNGSVCLLDLSVGLLGKFYRFSEAEGNNINSV